jgi:hypothetical protein
MPLFRESAMDAPKAFEIAAIKKIAWRILPLILVAYCIAYIDRSNILGGVDYEQGSGLQHLHLWLGGRHILPLATSSSKS